MALLILIPALLIVIIGLAWMFLMERNGEDDVQQAPVQGTSEPGERPDAGQ